MAGWRCAIIELATGFVVGWERGVALTTLEERVDRLESVFERFMAQTSTAITHMDMSIARMDRTIARLEQTVEEMKVQTESDRRSFQEYLRRADEAREQDRQSFQEYLRLADEAREQDRRSFEEYFRLADEAREQDRQSFQEYLRRADEAREQDRRSFEEYVRRADEAREQDRQEARQQRRELARQLGDISHRLGTIVEDMIAPSLRRMAQVEFDIGDEEFFALRARKYSPVTNQRREFDAIVVGTKAILLNDTKGYARPEYVTESVNFLKSGEFFEYFPEYAGKPLIPVFSSLYIPEEIVSYLTRQGIYAVAMGEETMQVLNLEEVRASSKS